MKYLNFFPDCKSRSQNQLDLRLELGNLVLNHYAISELKYKNAFMLLTE